MFLKALLHVSMDDINIETCSSNLRNIIVNIYCAFVGQIYLNSRKCKVHTSRLSATNITQQYTNYDNKQILFLLRKRRQNCV